MKLSTRARYGIQTMYDLACFGRDKPQPLKSIAERQQIPEAYLEQFIADLRREALVRSVRGAQGGYVLSRPPEEITIGMIFRALEGNLCMTDCLVEEDVCDRACTCPTRVVIQKIRDGINTIIDSITLKDMKDEYERMIAPED